MTKDKKEWECVGWAIYSVLHEAALKVVILDNGLISKVEIYYLYKHSIYFRYLLKVVLLFTSPPIYNWDYKSNFYFPLSTFCQVKRFL